MLYFDNAATTSIDEEVLNTYINALKKYYNRWRSKNTRRRNKCIRWCKYNRICIKRRSTSTHER